MPPWPTRLRWWLGERLQQARVLNRWLLRYSHDHPAGHPWYVNRLSKRIVRR